MKTFIVTSAYSTPLNGTAPDEVMYMPAGRSDITPSVNGKAKKITVNVTKETADVLQASLTQLLTEPVSPFVDFSHKGEESAATPTGFRWDERGVVMAVDWSAAGRSAVEGKVFKHISPTFLINESGEPCGLPEGPIAALTNRPAFKKNAKISASEEGATTGDDEPPKQKGKKKMADETAETVTAALRTELEALRAENKTLREAAETSRVEAINREADLLIESAVKDGKIAPKNETVKASLKKWAVTDLAGAKAHIESLPTNPAFKTVVTVTSAHRDIGKPAPVAEATSNADSGKQCKRRIEEVKAEYKDISNERAWAIAAARWPEEFQKVEA